MSSKISDSLSISLALNKKPLKLFSIISVFPPTVVVITGTLLAKLSSIYKLKHSMYVG